MRTWYEHTLFLRNNNSNCCIVIYIVFELLESVVVLDTPVQSLVLGQI